MCYKAQTSTKIKDECWFVYWSQTENTLMGFFCVGGPFHSHSEVQAAPPSTTAFFCKTETQHATQSCHINPSIKMSFYRLSLVCFIILIDLKCG